MSSRDAVETTRPIRLRTTLTATGQTTTPLVACPRQAEPVDAHACAACMRMLSLEWQPETGGEVRCIVSNEPKHVDVHADFGERAARTPVSEVSSPVVTCVTQDVPVARLREVLARTRQRALAVVDAEGKLEALVSRTDLARAPDAATAADVMTAEVHALPDDAPLSFAISLLAHDDISEVPLVTRDGTVTGICHALDIMRWLAKGLGYELVRR